MNPLALLANCKQYGVSIWLEGDRLKVSGEETTVAKFLPTLKAHKQNLVAFFTEWERDFYEERAAIAEFDGGLSRIDAEAQATQELITYHTLRTLH